ncbi:uncharacterized protein [Drosophila bipectinata]|uniref:uncharacterized protein n=1 Tax=Drosophila bipectinata TaxID=42026 RepID=UPI001C8ACDC4|nr:uncharacterized protein LOC108124677 [Drosophila bipectinata]
MQNVQILRNLCLFAAICSMAGLVLGACNSCQSNGVKCLNETYFEYCSDNVETGQVQACPDEQVCTEYEAFCMPSGATPACPDSEADGSCESCDGTNLFVCTSRTTFQMCSGTNLTGTPSSCKANTVCSIRSGKFCVDSCEVTGNLECDKTA